jgi:hypothetical protein
MATQKQKEAVDWFLGKARTARGYRNRLFNYNPGRARGTTMIGKMYFYEYDPKHKATLPIYDRYPLVFPIERYKDGFLGLNLHYLGVNERIYILGKLMKFASAKNMTEKSKLKLSYDLLVRTKYINTLSPCVKRYLSGHVRSDFIEITPDEWEKVIQLPVQMFITKG